MTRAPLSPDDETLLAVARSAARVPQPSAATTARRARTLEALVARHADRQARAVPRFVAVVAGALLATGAAATTALLLRPDTPLTTAPAHDDPAAVPGTARIRAPSPQAPPTATPTTMPATTMPATTMPATTMPATTMPATTMTSAPPEPVRPRARPPTVVREPARRADARVVSMPDERAAAPAVVVANEIPGPAAGPMVVDVPDDGGRRVARDRCIAGLRHRRDHDALDDCRTFGERFPDDDVARVVAFAAGGLAEDLGLLDEATRAYSRAIVLSSADGHVGDALLARARVRAARGELDEARADLGLFLHANPTAAARDDVQRLGRALRVPGLALPVVP